MLTSTHLRRMFPTSHIKFAVTCQSAKGLDLMICVDDPMAFHDANMVMNKKDYSIFMRSTAKLPQFRMKPQWKPIHTFQRNFAKVHFNTTKVNLETGTLRDGNTQLRYGVVKYSDVISDLNKWNTLVASTFFTRPHEITQLDLWSSSDLMSIPPAQELPLAQQ